MNSKANLLLAVLMTGFGAAPVSAQTFTILYSFTANGDGAMPMAGLLLAGNTLYGTTFGGGFENGSVFAVNTDGTGFRAVHNFSGSDGAQPSGSLIMSGDILYGTARDGGSSDYGTVFQVNIDGTGFNILHNFTTADGAYPEAALLLTQNTFYGTTWQGSVFSMNIDGSAFQVLHYFSGNDGGNVGCNLVLSDNTLYGTGYGDPNSPDLFPIPGTVFAMNTDGSGFRVLNTFLPGSHQGAGPYGGLVLSGNTFYGTTKEGGTNNVGTVFRVNTDGTGFTVLHSFTGLLDGAIPAAALVLSGNTLYGTASGGGTGGNGTVFQLNTDGTGFTSLQLPPGAVPQGALIISGNTLYGTTSGGGSYGHGTVFRISLPVTAKPAIAMFGQKLVLTWPTNATGSLQSTTNLSSPVWTAVSTPPVVVSGQNTVTNPISGTQQFFRLSQ